MGVSPHVRAYDTHIPILHAKLEFLLEAHCLGLQQACLSPIYLYFSLQTLMVPLFPQFKETAGTKLLRRHMKFRQLHLNSLYMILLNI